METLREQSVTAGQDGGFSGFFLSGNHSRDQPSAPLLKATDAERTGLRTIIKEGDWYNDEQATAAAFRKALRGSAVLHISSHAFTKTNGLDAPHIELFDAPFYLFELKGLEHHPALVVLSACRTGDWKDGNRRRGAEPGPRLYGGWRQRRSGGMVECE